MDKRKSHIYIEFAAGTKNFVFPNAFIDGFLKMK